MATLTDFLDLVYKQSQQIAELADIDVNNERELADAKMKLETAKATASLATSATALMKAGIEATRVADATGMYLPAIGNPAPVKWIGQDDDTKDN